jgi:hypothetical protein
MIMNASKYFDGIIKSAIKSVYDGINEKTEDFRKSFDLLKRIRNNHFRRLEQTISNIQILGMAGPTPLTDIYISTRLSERVSRNFFVDLDEAQSIKEIRLLVKQTEIDIKNFIKGNRSILVLGGPGAGKTTFLAALALGHAGLCKKAEVYIEKRLFPIWIPFRSNPTPTRSYKKLILDSIAVDEKEDYWPFLNRILQSGQALLIFDGLDEIPFERQSDWRDTLLRIQKKYNKCQIIVSCRSGGLYVDFPSFKHAEILPFYDEDVNLFIDNWFGIEHSEIAMKLKNVLKNGFQVHELTGNPLLLSLLCILFEHDLELPRHRVDLYNRCVETMLVKWDTSRGFRRDSKFTNLSIAKRRRIFQRVAVELTNLEKTVLPENPTISVVGKYIEKFDMEHGDANEVLSELEAHHGLLIKPAANAYSFSHISFQDYFTAEFITSTHKELEFFRKNATNPRKQDIIVFTACLMEDASILINEMLTLSDLRGKQYYPTIARRLIVASLMVRALGSGAPMSPKLRNEIATRIINYFKYATDHFQDTGLNLYCTLISSECKVRHTFFKRRETASDSLLALEVLVNEIMASNYNPLLDVIEESLNGKLNYSSRALLAASLIRRSPKIVLENYKKLLRQKLPKIYREAIQEVVDELEAQIDN